MTDVGGEQRQRRRLDGGDPNTAQSAAASAAGAAAAATGAMDPFTAISLADEVWRSGLLALLLHI
jgi:hypothetical protein